MEETGSNDVEIDVVKGDVKEQNVDVVVNVTYSCGGDIHESTLFQHAEGPDVPTLKPHISVCDRRVLHVCLPDIGPAPSTCQVSNVVNQSVLDCLRYANIHYYNSIAFPAVGLELYPAEVIAQSMFEAVLEFEEEQAATHSTPTLGRVVFAICPTNHAVDDHFVLETFGEWHEQFYEDGDLQVSEIREDREQVDLDTDDVMDEVDSPAGYSRPSFRDLLTNSGPLGRPTPGTHSGTHTRQLPPLTTNKKRRRKKTNRQQASIHCPIVIGNIAQQVADVIVCSVGKKLNLSNATAASAVLRVGGRDLQRDLYTKYPRGCEATEIATTTRRGGLQCEDVYCVVLAKHDSVEQNLKGLEMAITNCLLQADRTKRTSLAFPALGTGKQSSKYQEDAVARCMFDTVRRFASQHHRTSIRSVMFVLRETDKSVQEAFRNETKLHTTTTTNTICHRNNGSSSDEEWPTTWRPMGSKTCHLFVLSEECFEYEDILNSFKNTMPEDTCIVKVERIQNEFLYMKYTAARKTMQRKNPSIQNEYILWHGTSPDVVESICINGFNRCYRGKNGTKYGEGTYFAKSPSVSHGYTTPDRHGYRYMFKTCVLTGQYT